MQWRRATAQLHGKTQWRTGPSPDKAISHAAVSHGRQGNQETPLLAILDSILSRYTMYVCLTSTQ